MTDGGAQGIGTDEGRLLPFDGVVNFRDLGGYRTESGLLTRWRTVYRSDALHRLTADDLELFHQLGIRAVYDLRSDEERLGNPNPVASRQIPVESRVTRGEFTDGTALKDASDADNRLLEVYLAILSTGGPFFGELLSALATPGELPAVIHCAGGKDRTGLATALLLSSLGVDRTTVLDDYELTNHFITARRVEEVVTLFAAAGMTPEAALAFTRAPRPAMAAALAWLDDEFGGVEAYLVGPCGVSPGTTAALRERLLERR